MNQAKQNEAQGNVTEPLNAPLHTPEPWTPAEVAAAHARLYKAVWPFVKLLRNTSGRIPTERLSHADWNELNRAYEHHAPAPADPAVESANDKALERTCEERDEAEEAVSEIYFRIIGRSPQWSNLFGHKQAIEEIVEAFDLVRAHVKSLLSFSNAIMERYDARQSGGQSEGSG